MKDFVVYRAQLLVHANFDIDSLVPRNILMQMLFGIQVNIFLVHLAEFVPCNFT